MLIEELVGLCIGVRVVFLTPGCCKEVFCLSVLDFFVLLLIEKPFSLIVRINIYVMSHVAEHKCK